MRFILSICLLFGFAKAAMAQNAEGTPSLIPLENGYVLEIIPAEFKTFTGETPEEYKTPQYHVFIIPAVYEMITVTKVVQEAYTDLKVIPAVRGEKGEVLRAAQLSLNEVPAVTKQVSRRVEKTPARQVKRRVPNLYHPGTIRKRVKDAEYILRDAQQVEIGRFDRPEDLLARLADVK